MAFKDILEIELHRYKREIGHMTKEEWNLLVDWVYSGHSLYISLTGLIIDVPFSEISLPSIYFSKIHNGTNVTIPSLS